MRKLFILVCLCLVSSFSYAENDSKVKDIYVKTEMNLYISLDVFKKAYSAYIEYSEKEFLVIINYAVDSTKKRFFVINMDTMKIMWRTLVSHGVNTGLLHATKFSNEVGSKQTSLGVFVTGGWHNGRLYKKALKLHGKSPGLNDNAFRRAIIIHGAKYVFVAKREKGGVRLGVSHGCPALPLNLSQEIIMNGIVVYAHGINV